MSETTDAGVDSGRAPNSPRRPHGGGSDPATGVFGLSGQSCPTPRGGAPGAPDCAVMPAGSGDGRDQDRVATNGVKLH